MPHIYDLNPKLKAKPTKDKTLPPRSVVVLKENLMLAELAAANAAFAIIRKTISNTGEIAKAGRTISDL